MYTCAFTSNFSTSIFECTLFVAEQFRDKHTETRTVLVKHDMYSDNEAAAYLNKQADKILTCISRLTNPALKSLYAGDFRYIKIENKVISVVFDDCIETY